MTVIINKKLSKKKIAELLSKTQSTPKVFDAYKYLGIAKTKGEPLQIQQELRDE